MVYSMVIRPIMTYGALAWHQARGDGLDRVLAGSIAPLRNRCLRVIAGAYRATPVSTLEAEAYILPLSLYLDALASRATQRLEDSGMARKVEGICREVRRHLYARGQNWRKPFTEYIHPQPLPAGWHSEWTKEDRPEQVLLARWRAQWGNRREPWGSSMQGSQGREEGPEGLLGTYQGPLLCTDPGALRQDWAGWLPSFTGGVPGVVSPSCPCGQGAETPKHILVHRERYQGASALLEEDGQVDTRHLLCTAEGAQCLSQWWLNIRLHGL